MNEDGYALELQGIEKSFQNGMEKLDIFRDVNLSLKFNEAVALIGPSGAGKSTLLQIAGLLTKPSGGTVRIATHDATLARPHKRTKLRRKNIGFIYQFHHLLAEFTALENVMMPLLINGITNVKAKQRAGALLTDVGLGARAMHRPAELSGGERQRVAIARAIVAEPALILADEPTGNLDPKNAENIFAMILSLVKKRNIALLMVTHNYDLAKVMDAVYELDNGVIIPH